MNALTGQPSAFRIVEKPIVQQKLLDPTPISVSIIDLTERPAGQLEDRVTSHEEDNDWKTTQSKCALLSVILFSAVAFSGATYAAVHVNAGFAVLAGVSGMTGIFTGIFYVKVVFF